MSDNVTDAKAVSPCCSGCKASVPSELQAEGVCLQHFILSIERDCADMRREAAMERLTSARKLEVHNYIKSTAMKLSDVTTGRTRLSDDLKKRVLTNFLTLMNLQESIDRSAKTLIRIEPRTTPVAAVPIVAIAGH